MALENKKNLVQFGYGYNAESSKVAGMLSFDPSAQAIYVGDGEKANLVSSSVRDAVLNEGVLTITKIDGKVYTLDFSDVASASGVSLTFKALDERVAANATAIDNLDADIALRDSSIRKDFADADKALDASLKTYADGLDASIRKDFAAADASLDERIVALEGLVGEDGDVNKRIADAVAAEAELRANADASIRDDFAAADASLDSSLKSYVDTKVSKLGGSKSGSDASGFVTVKVDTAAGEVSSVTVTGTDIASAQELSRVAGRIDTFLDSEEVAGTVDTLHEIQVWMNGEGVNATELTKAIADEAKLRSDADEALGKRIDDVSTAALQAAADAEKNAKNYADEKATAAKNAVTASGDAYIDANATNGAISISLKQSTKNSLALADSAVQEIKTGSTNGTILVDGASVAVAGLGSAAYTEASAYEVAGAEGRAKNYAEEQATAAKNNVIGTANDNSTSITLYGVKKYAEEQATAAREAATVTGVNSNSVADASSFVAISLKLDNKNVAVNSVNVDVQEVASADADHKGLAEASDVKSYVDNQIDVNALRWNLL